jgi:hypothetical protein
LLKRPWRSAYLLAEKAVKVIGAREATDAGNVDHASLRVTQQVLDFFQSVASDLLVDRASNFFFEDDLKGAS